MNYVKQGFRTGIMPQQSLNVLGQFPFLLGLMKFITEYSVEGMTQRERAGDTACATSHGA